MVLLKNIKTKSDTVKPLETPVMPPVEAKPAPPPADIPVETKPAPPAPAPTPEEAKPEPQIEILADIKRPILTMIDSGDIAKITESISNIESVVSFFNNSICDPSRRLRMSDITDNVQKLIDCVKLLSSTIKK